MECANCGTELIPGKSFCHACGAATPQACTTCGATLVDGFRFCPDCGAAVALREAGAAAAAGETPARAPELGEHQADTLYGPRRAVEGERKLVTVFFCDLAGSTAIAERLDPEEYRDLLEQYVALAFREIYRFEGIVNQLAGDGLMALFGAPIAREDAPARAVWAGLAILQALGRLNARLRASGRPELHARIGIHTGPVVVGTVGNDQKMDYTAIGDTTNLASRLESLAEPGSILVSDETHAMVRGFFEMKPVGPFTVKGKSAPVVAYEVIRRRDAVTPIAIAAERGLTPLIGREEELAHLESCFARVHGHLPQVVAVVGETGIGRSRLVYEFKERLSPAPRMFEARCSALNQRVPFYPWVSMLQEYFGIEEEEAPEDAVAKVLARAEELGPDVANRVPYLLRMLSLPVDDDTDEVAADDLERETFDAVGHIFHAEGQRGPVLIILEDMHWIDGPSRAMLSRALAKLHHAPAMFVLTYRPEFDATWTTGAVLTQIRLRRLSDEAATEIVRSVADGPLPARLERQILEKAEGSPFYAEEITRSLLESGILERTDGRYRLTRPVEEIRLPGTVQEVIAARLDSLEPGAKRVLQVAAVVGRQFHRDQLDGLLDDGGIDVDAALAELERRGVVHRKNVFSDDVYRFGERLTQEVAYDGLLLRQRRQLHERIGRSLESALGDWSPERSALLAHHYVNSENVERAVQALLRAAGDAEKVPAYHAAADYYREAWEIASRRAADGGADDVRPLAVAAAQGLGRMIVLYSAPSSPSVLDVFKEAAATAESLGDEAAKATLQTYRGMETMTRVPGQFDRGIAMVEEALANAELAGESLPGMARGLAWAYLLDGRFELARRTIDRAIGELAASQHGRGLGDVYVGALYLRDRIDYYRGHLDAAERGARATREIALRAGNRTVQGGSAATLAGVAYFHGNYDEATRWAEICLAMTRDVGHPFGRRTEAAIALLARRAGGHEVSLERFGEWLDGDVPIDGDTSLGLPWIVTALRATGHAARARALARQGYEVAAGRLRRMLAAVALAEALEGADDDDAEAAECLYREAATTADAVGSVLVSLSAHLGIAECAARRGDHAAAAADLPRLEEACREHGLATFRARLDALACEVAPSGDAAEPVLAAEV